MTAVGAVQAWLWPVVMLVGLAVAAWGLMLLLRHRAHQRATPVVSEVHDASRAILADRLARGEIGQAEFRRRMDVLDER